MPGARDAAAPMLLAAGVLARHEAEIGHQRAAATGTDESHAARPGSGSPSTCRSRGSTATTRPAHDTAPSRAISASRASSSTEPRLELIDRQQIVVDDDALGRLRPRRDCRSTADAPASSCARCSAGRGAAATCPSDGDTAADLRAHHPAPGTDRGPLRLRASAAAPPSASPARSSSASLRASRRFVLTRSPGFRGISAGAIT